MLNRIREWFRERRVLAVAVILIFVGCVCLYQIFVTPLGLGEFIESSGKYIPWVIPPWERIFTSPP